MVQRRLGDAQLVGDVLQRHAPEPLGGDDFDGGLQDLQVAFLLTHTLAFDEGPCRDAHSQLLTPLLIVSLIKPSNTITPSGL